MSRSNPTETSSNPCQRWFEYAGGNDGGHVRYYDKEAAQSVNVGEKFAFLLLDELATVKGWHDNSDSGIYANEVKDLRQDVLVVKSFKGGELASGLYSQIKDRVGNFGGHFHASCYIAFKDGDKYRLGNIGFKGASLRAWMDFKKSAGRRDGRPAYFIDAIKIDGYDEGTKGKVTFRTPRFSLTKVSDEANAEAMNLDQELQSFLADYLKRPKAEAAAPAQEAHASQPANGDVPFDDDIPF